LLDDNLYMHFQAGRIGMEEAIDKSKNPAGMVDKMQKAGVHVDIKDEALEAEAAEVGAAAPVAGPASAAAAAAPKPGGMSDSERAAQVAANRARLMAQQQKR